MLRSLGQSGRHGSGFTLLELIMVIVILGIAAAVLVPQLNVGGERVRLVTAARSIVQASRYARTMALLHQAETELVLNPATGLVEVRAHASGYKGDVLAVLAEESAAADEEMAFADDETDPGYNDGAATRTNLVAEVATAQSFADEIGQSFPNKDITFAFVGYTDTVDNDGAAAPIGAEDDKAPIVLVFRSNGTCRPFTVRALTEEGDYLDVSVDVIGKAKIEEYGDED